LTTYFDRSVLVRAYAPGITTSVALALIQRVKPPIPLTHLHRIEIRNALRLKRGRGEITEAELSAALRLFQGDIDAGRLDLPVYELAALFHRAESLSDKPTTSTPGTHTGHTPCSGGT